MIVSSSSSNSSIIGLLFAAVFVGEGRLEPFEEEEDNISSSVDDDELEESRPGISNGERKTPLLLEIEGFDLFNGRGCGETKTVGFVEEGSNSIKLPLAVEVLLRLLVLLIVLADVMARNKDVEGGRRFCSGVENGCSVGEIISFNW